MIRAMLEVQVPNRPSTKEILDLVRHSIPFKVSGTLVTNLVRVSNCVHLAKGRFMETNQDYYRLTKTRIRLFDRSRLWKHAQWKRHWYNTFVGINS